MKQIAMVSLFVCVASVGANAASLAPIRGEVLLNTGAGFKTISNEVDVKAGDSILVNPKGLARLSYDDGTSYEIKPGDVVYVVERSPIGPVGSISHSESLPGSGMHTLVIGGLTAAVGVGVIAGIANATDKPSSP